MNAHLLEPNLTDMDVCQRIETLTTSMMAFWKDSRGWAPDEVSQLLSKSMLEWQASLSSSLFRWLTSSSEGDLILAWANLGALVEGQLKLFLSVYYRDYVADAEPIIRRGKLVEPDGCNLERLREFFRKRIWTTGQNWDSYVQHVQQRRNSIHAYKRRDIGTFHEWRSQVHRHLLFLRDINGRLPYPDEIHIPGEI